MSAQEVSAISALLAQPPLASTSGAASVPPLSGTQPGSFGQFVGQGLEQVNRQLAAGQADLQRLAVGDVSNLHQVMVRLEESRLAFQLALQVRNRLLEAYQDVMKMQI